MSGVKPDTTKTIINTVWHGVVISAFTVGYSMIGEKLLKFDVGDPSKNSMTIIKLIIPVTLAVYTKDWLVAQNIIDDNPIKMS